ncbi:hypothetical protein BXZ70DRAFT_1011216 [Cristinia sonorae]|uniref:Dirigent protein n=1 Tax=Cristinia sonorae TaxID=1940300 RepID=A0A8K0XLU3_9AGAR|nr:hypothetical protein BXZ70DRAFT_1011216 [Cristinia sonorae]
MSSILLLLCSLSFVSCVAIASTSSHSFIRKLWNLKVRHTPAFEPVFSISVPLGPKNPVKGPFGTRTNMALLSGIVNDASGKPIGHIVPHTSVANGVVSANGTYFPTVSITIQWGADDTYAYLSLSGVGVLGSTTMVYIRMDTDGGSKFAAWGQRFLIGEVSYPDPNGPALFKVFALE